MKPDDLSKLRIDRTASARPAARPRRRWIRYGAAAIAVTNFQTFADLAFRFTLTPAIAAKTILFSLAMGLIGGFLPALRAARLETVDSLRAA